MQKTMVRRVLSQKHFERVTRDQIDSLFDKAFLLIDEPNNLKVRFFNGAIQTAIETFVMIMSEVIHRVYSLSPSNFNWEKFERYALDYLTQKSAEYISHCREVIRQAEKHQHHAPNPVNTDEIALYEKAIESAYEATNVVSTIIVRSVTETRKSIEGSRYPW